MAVAAASVAGGKGVVPIKAKVSSAFSDEAVIAFKPGDVEVDPSLSLAAASPEMTSPVAPDGADAPQASDDAEGMESTKPPHLEGAAEPGVEDEGGGAVPAPSGEADTTDHATAAEEAVTSPGDEAVATADTEAQQSPGSSSSEPVDGPPAPETPHDPDTEATDALQSVADDGATSQGDAGPGAEQDEGEGAEGVDITVGDNSAPDGADDVQGASPDVSAEADDATGATASEGTGSLDEQNATQQEGDDAGSHEAPASYPSTDSMPEPEPEPTPEPTPSLPEVSQDPDGYAVHASTAAAAAAAAAADVAAPATEPLVSELNNSTGEDVATADMEIHGDVGDASEPLDVSLHHEADARVPAIVAGGAAEAATMSPGSASERRPSSMKQPGSARSKDGRGVHLDLSGSSTRLVDQSAPASSRSLHRSYSSRRTLSPPRPIQHDDGPTMEPSEVQSGAALQAIAQMARVGLSTLPRPVILLLGAAYPAGTFRQ